MEGVGQAVAGNLVGLRQLWLHLQVIVELDQASEDHGDGLQRRLVCSLSRIEARNVRHDIPIAIDLLRERGFAQKNCAALIGARATADQE